MKSYFNKKRFILFFLTAVLFCGLLSFAGTVFAASSDTLDLGISYGAGTGLSNTDIRVTIVRIIRVALSLLGIVALGLILYAGFVWMTAGGNDEEIGKAKKILINSVIGLAIILSAYSIVSFVMSKLIGATTGVEAHCSNGFQDADETGIDCGGGCGACSTQINPYLVAANTLYVTSLPASGKTCVPNPHPVISFNRSVNIDSVNGNILLEKEGGVVASGTWSHDGARKNVVIFSPSGQCLAGGNDCLEANATYTIRFTNVSSSSIKALVAEPSGTFPSLSGCRKNGSTNFSNCAGVQIITGDKLDVSVPTVNFLSPSAGASLQLGDTVNIRTKYIDDLGAQDVLLFEGENLIETKTFQGCEPVGISDFSWNTAGLATSTHTLTAVVHDWTSKSGSAERSFVLRPAHCFNEIRDFDETNLNCGGADCGNCPRETCDKNEDCASGWCQDGFCADRMFVSDFSPRSGAPGTYVTIAGKYFGSTPGTVLFSARNIGTNLYKNSSVDWTQNNELPDWVVEKNGNATAVRIIDWNAVGLEKGTGAVTRSDFITISQPINVVGGNTSTAYEGSVDAKLGHYDNVSSSLFLMITSQAFPSAGNSNFLWDFESGRWVVVNDTNSTTLSRFDTPFIKTFSVEAESNKYSFEIPSNMGLSVNYIWGFEPGAPRSDIVLDNFVLKEVSHSSNFVARLAPCAGSWSENQIIVEVPDGVLTGPIAVQTAGASSTIDYSNDDYGSALPDFVANTVDHPGICAISPLSGKPGDEFVITGKKFGRPGKVVFGGPAATVTSWAENMVRGKVPLSEAKSVGVSIQNSNRIDSNSVRFNILGSQFATDTPMISEVSPAIGQRGSIITIKGKNFGKATGYVWFKTIGDLSQETIMGELSDFPEECKATLWRDDQIIVKFPKNHGNYGYNYTVQVYNTEISAASPLNNEIKFNLTDGKPGPGICFMDPVSGPSPFPEGNKVSIVGQYFDTVLSDVLDGIVLRQTFDRADVVNGVARDSSGAGIDGRLTRIFGNIPQVDEGQIKEALRFISEDGSYVNFDLSSTSLDFASSSFSVSLWYKSAFLSESTFYVVRRDCGQDCGYWGIKKMNDHLYFEVKPTPQSDVTSVDFGKVVDGKWHHVAAVLDRGDQTIRTLIDGKLKDSADISVLGDIITSNGENRLRVNTTNNTISDSASIDDLRIYNRALTTRPEVEFIYSFNTGVPNLGTNPEVYFWKQGAVVDSVVNRAKAEVLRLFDVPGGQKMEVSPTGTSQTGPVALYRPLDNKLSNSLNFSFSNCKLNNPQCPGTLNCCDNGMCQSASCGDTKLSTGYVWRFCTQDIPAIPYVLERCNTSTLPTPSPSFTNSGDLASSTCLTSLAIVEFSTFISTSTVNENSVKIFKCRGGINGNNCVDPIQESLSPASFTLLSATQDNEYLSIQRNAKRWEPLTAYQVVLTDDIKSIADANGISVSLAKKRPCVATVANSSYCYTFKTGNVDCTLGYVGISPYSYLTNVLEYPIMRRIAGGVREPLQYRGFGISNQKCIAMDMSDYNWAWSVSNRGAIYASINGATTAVSAKVNAVANTVGIRDLESNPRYAVNINGRATRPATATRTLDDKTGSSPLTIDLSNPEIVDFWPKCLEACTNGQVGVKFNTSMSDRTKLGYVYGAIDQQAVRLYRCNDENCRVLTQINNGNLTFNLDRMTLNIAPIALTTNTLYLVKISAPSTTSQIPQLGSVASPGGSQSFGAAYDKEFSWRFRTKSIPCLIDRVQVEPSLFTAILVGEKAIFSAQPFSASDDCSAQGQRLNPFSAGWNWNSSSSSVATVSSFSTIGKNRYCTSNCLRKGSDVPALTGQVIPVCGNGRVEAGEDCDVPNKNTGCGLNCLRVGNASSTTCGNGILETNLGEQCERVMNNSVNGQIGYWKFEDTFYSGFSTIFTALPPGDSRKPSFVSDGRSGKSLDFDGLDDYLTVASPQAADYATFAIEFWARLNSSASPMTVVGVAGELGLNEGGFWLTKNDDHRLTFGYTKRISMSPYTTSGASKSVNLPNINLAIWNHFVIQKMYSSAALYVNGQLVGDVQIGSDTLKTKGFRVGSRDVNPLLGKIDELSIYSRALGEQEILSHLSSGISLTTTELQGCGENCLFTGSLTFTDSSATGESLCGNGTLGLGEQCDVGIGADPELNSTSYGCTPNCLRAGTKISSKWCVDNTLLRAGFTLTEYKTACDNSLSVCGNGVSEPDEDPGCDTGTVSSACNEYCLYKSRDAEEDISDNECPGLAGSLLSAREGCIDRHHAGSSLLYSTPSYCGDGETGIGEDSFCESFFTSTNTLRVNGLSDPWALVKAVGLGEVDEMLLPPAQLSDIVASTNNNTPPGVTKSGSGEFRINCGFTSDSQCPAGQGLALNSCCVDRSEVLSVYPGNSTTAEIGICPNTAIEVGFSGYIDAKTLPGNFIIAKGQADTICASGTRRVELTESEYLLSSAPWYKRIFYTVSSFFRRIFSDDASAGDLTGLTWCAGADVGTPEVLLDFASSSSRILLKLNKPLSYPDAHYVIILKNGLRDLRGVSIGDAPINNRNYWAFSTAGDICKVKSTEVYPSEVYFDRVGATSTLETDVQSDGGRRIQAITGYYNWEVLWNPPNNPYVEIPNSTSSPILVTSTNRQGDTYVVASINITESVSDSPMGIVATGKSHITINLCENPWPPKNLMIDGVKTTITPYEDTQGNIDNFDTTTFSYDGTALPASASGGYFNFSTHYCADSGISGTTTDDLPLLFPTVHTTVATLGNAVGAPMKRFIFTNNRNSDAIGIQIFPNPDHYTVQEWYEKDKVAATNTGFIGNLQSLTVNGYDAGSNGNNVYVDALNLSENQGGSPERRLFNNIYLFSINADAKEETKKVFDQMIKNLKLNINLTNYGYCGNNSENPEFLTPCSNDLQCGGKICSVTIDKLKNNYKRLKLLADFEALMDNYADTHARKYPAITEGSYISGQTISTWPSWSLLGQGKIAVPVDPINQLGDSGTCASSTNVFCTLDSQCPSSPTQEKCVPHNIVTGWSDMVDRYSFACATSSYVFRYSFSTSTGYMLRAKFERPFDVQNSEAINNWTQDFVNKFISDPAKFKLDDNSGICNQDQEILSLQGGYCGDGIINFDKVANRMDACDPPGSERVDACGSARYQFNLAEGIIDARNVFTCSPGCQFVPSTTEFGSVVRCSYTSRCGNNLKEEGEQCDNGALNGKNGNDCSRFCQLASLECGNGFVSSTEVCDWKLPGENPPGGGFVQNRGKCNNVVGTIKECAADRDCSVCIGDQNIFCNVDSDCAFVAGRCGVSGSVCGSDDNCKGKCENNITKDCYINSDCGDEFSVSGEVVHPTCVKNGNTCEKTCQPASVGSCIPTSLYTLADPFTIVNLASKIRYSGINKAGSCNWDCKTFGPYCGDGVVQKEFGEECDGNESCQIGSTAGQRICSSECKLLSPATGWWRFEKGGSNWGDDSSPNRLGATSLSRDALLTPGRVGNAALFNGTNKLTISRNDKLSGSQFTISTWVNPTDGNLSNVSVLKANKEGGYGFTYNEADNKKIKFSVFHHPGVEGSFTSPEQIPLNAWTHVVGTYDGSVARLYINGELAGNSSPVVMTTSSGAEGAIRIASIGDWTANPKYFKGRLDEITYYDRVLTTQEIQDYYNNQAGWFCSSSVRYNGVAQTAVSGCGDGKQDTNEACDNGAQNGVACTPPNYGDASKACVYCSADCSNKISVNPAKVCGDGKVDVVNNSTGLKESCDFAGGDIWASVASGATTGGLVADRGGFLVQSCSQSSNSHVYYKGTRTCENSCMAFAPDCLPCGEDATNGSIVKGSVINVLRPSIGYDGPVINDRDPCYQRAFKLSIGDQVTCLGVGPLDLRNPVLTYRLDNISSNPICSRSESSDDPSYVLKVFDEVSGSGQDPNTLHHVLFPLVVTPNPKPWQYDVILSPKLTASDNSQEIRIVVSWTGAGNETAFNPGFIIRGNDGVLAIDDMDLQSHAMPSLPADKSLYDYRHLSRLGIWYHSSPSFSNNTHHIRTFTMRAVKSWVAENVGVQDLGLEVASMDPDFMDEYWGMSSGTYAFYIYNPYGIQSSNANLRVDVYFPETSEQNPGVYSAPERTFYLNKAKTSDNGQSEYWHVFNIKSRESEAIIRDRIITPIDRDLNGVGVMLPNGKIVTSPRDFKF